MGFMLELYHHGIRGQKWGQRNGPPYPLSPGQRSSAEKKSNSNGNSKGSATAVAALVALNVFANIPLIVKKAKQIRNTKLNEKAWETEKQRYSLTTPSEISPNTLEEYDHKADLLYEHRSIDKLKNAKRIEGTISTDDSLKTVNPGFPNPGTIQNCTFCSMAMAMREKGYDVKATTTMHPWNTDSVYKKAFKGSKTERVDLNNPKPFIEKFVNVPDGSYGEVTMQWHLGGGHSLFFKKENGSLTVYDGQAGKKYDMNKFIKTFHNKSVITEFTRWDNCEPTEYVLAFLEENK